MVTLIDISKTYGKKQVINNLSLDIKKGECVAIAGKNSAGKTTLLSIVAGRIKSFNGNVNIKGKMAFVPQYEELLTGLTVYDHISLWYSAYNKNTKDIFCEDSFEYKLGLFEYKKMPVGKLSGGRAQRLSIALALITNPDIIIMDEPFASLDIVSRDEVALILQEIKKEGKAMIIASHIIGSAASLWDRVLILEDGKITKEINQKELQLSGEQLEKQVINSFI